MVVAVSVVVMVLNACKSARVSAFPNDQPLQNTNAFPVKECEKVW